MNAKVILQLVAAVLFLAVRYRPGRPSYEWKPGPYRGLMVACYQLQIKRTMSIPFSTQTKEPPKPLSNRRMRQKAWEPPATLIG